MHVQQFQPKSFLVEMALREKDMLLVAANGNSVKSQANVKITETSLFLLRAASCKNMTATTHS